MINYKKFLVLKKIHKGGSFTLTAPFHMKEVIRWWKENQMRVEFSRFSS